MPDSATAGDARSPQRVALGLGLPADDLLAVRDWDAHDSLGGAERAVLAATDEVVHDGAVSARTWAACERALGANSAVLICSGH
jgi:alkylhydroperoxidase family enzyme